MESVALKFKNNYLRISRIFLNTSIGKFPLIKYSSFSLIHIYNQFQLDWNSRGRNHNLKRIFFGAFQHGDKCLAKAIPLWMFRNNRKCISAWFVSKMVQNKSRKYKKLNDESTWNIVINVKRIPVWHLKSSNICTIQ